jgi:hypothetical protein
MATATGLLMPHKSATSTDEPIVIVMPVYNDWSAFVQVVEDLDVVLADAGLAASIVAVDDASTMPLPDATGAGRFKAVRSIEVLSLRRNLGHQRAIALGLAFVHSRAAGTVVVMDSDGEDSPADVPRLLERLRQEDARLVVFAERTRRSESVVFQAGYALYRIVHFILTGRGVRFGNFSAVPAARLNALVGAAELWNHFAAAVVKTRQPYCTIPTQRAKRLDGKSAMRYVDLVVHGLSAISVYGDIIGARLLIGVLVLGVSLIIGIATAIGVGASAATVPGWVSIVVALMLIMLFQTVLFAFFLSFVILNGRQANSFLPYRDYTSFVAGTHVLFPKS